MKEFLNKAIQDGNINMLKKLLKEGAMISNDNNKTNSLNCAICSTLNTKINKYNLEFIKDLMHNGAKTCNYLSGPYDTLSIAINRGMDYIKNSYDKNLAEIQVLDLIQTLIDHGVKPNNEKNGNTFSFIIQTENLKFIELIMKINPLPFNNIEKTHQILNLDCSTLTYAVRTKNIAIVKIAIKHGAKPSPSTLSYAVKTQNLEIITQIIICNCAVLDCLHNPGNQYTYNFYQQNALHLLYEIYVKKKDNDIDIEYFNKLINVIMCSGNKMCSDIWNDIINRDRLKYNIQGKNEHEYELENKLMFIESKFITCYKLLNPCNSSHIESPEYGDEIVSLKKLKEELKITMRQLMEIPYVKNELFEEIQKSFSFAVPLLKDLIEIIYEYLCESMIKYIDWDLYPYSIK